MKNHRAQLLRGLSAEQVLMIADDVCHRFPDTIRDYAALNAISAATTARLHGVAVHVDPINQANHAYATVMALRPLGSRNDLLAETVRRTLLTLNADF